LASLRSRGAPPRPGAVAVRPRCGHGAAVVWPGRPWYAPVQDMARQTILILDFGSQYTQLIARRIREHGVYSEIHPYRITMDQIRARAPVGIVLSGGPSSCYAEGAPTIDPALFTLGIPVLGICYGAQLTAKLLGGTVEPAGKHEYGRAQLR